MYNIILLLFTLFLRQNVLILLLFKFHVRSDVSVDNEITIVILVCVFNGRVFKNTIMLKSCCFVENGRLRNVAKISHRWYNWFYSPPGIQCIFPPYLLSSTVERSCWASPPVQEIPPSRFLEFDRFIFLTTIIPRSRQQQVPNRVG